MTRRLVITADDLGRERASSLEILALLRERAVTSCSLITVSADSAEAARGAAELGIAPHVHLTLTSERELAPWHPLSPGSTLHAGAGELPTARSLDPAALSRGEVVGEMDAQLAWMHRAGLRPRAADSHAGVLYGLAGTSFVHEALTWSARHGLWFRLPREPGPLLPHLVPAPVLGELGPLVEHADSLGVPLPQTVLTNPSPASRLGSYEALRSQAIALLAELPEGTSELFLHPAPDAAEIPAERVWESRLLRDEAWHDALQREDITLVSSWWD